MHLSLPVYRLKRNARTLAREQSIPLHAALDQIARAEGFNAWSHLASEHANANPAKRLLEELEPGHLVLLGARPRHGKTLLGLELMVEADRAGRGAAFFSLEYTHTDVLALLSDLEVEPSNLSETFVCDCSDEICGDYIVNALADATPGTIAVVDYLQLMDQKRANPPLMDQITQLRSFAARRRVTMMFLSQIDRGFTARVDAHPGPEDVRLPNPLDLSLFDQTWFLHDGKIELRNAA